MMGTRFSSFDRSRIWNSDRKIIRSCSLCRDQKYEILIPLNLYSLFRKLVKEISTEWLLYLKFEKEETGSLTRFRITDYIVPDQRVTYSSVEVLHAPSGELGVIHAHQFSSSSFFSAIDEEYVNSNNAFSLVINRNGDLLGGVRIQLPCGNYLFKECEINILYPEIPETVIEDIKSHFKPQKVESYYYGFKSVSEHMVIDFCPFLGIEEQCPFPSYYDEGCIYVRRDCPKR